MRRVEQVLRYAEQVLREEVGRLYDASSELRVQQGAAHDEPPGTTQQAQLADVVVEERLLVARLVLDVVDVVAQVMWVISAPSSSLVVGRVSSCW